MSSTRTTSTRSSASATREAPLLLRQAVVVPPALVATLLDDVIVLATADGEVSVQVPLDPSPWSSSAESLATASTGALAAVSVVCVLDTALARRLYRRVSAWHPDADGRLTARVRPAA